MDFTNPDTGETVQGTHHDLSCPNPECVGFEEVLEVWDFGTGVYCGGCGHTFFEPLPTDPEVEHGN